MNERETLVSFQHYHYLSASKTKWRTEGGVGGELWGVTHFYFREEMEGKIHLPFETEYNIKPEECLLIMIRIILLTVDDLGIFLF